MLEKIDLNKKMSKQEYSESLPKIEAELGRLQRECKDLDIPVMIVFEGFGASGKGLQIGKLIHSMDPRGFEVHTIKNETEEEWKRAYKEINDMEKDLANAGAVILKFWMHIDKEEQKRRFCERMENPEKRWKITDEDLRNREKWDLYEHAADEMIMRTSTAYAPWVIVEGNDKYYARIKVLKTVTDAIEKRLKER